MKKTILLLTMMLMPLLGWADDSGMCGENLTWTYSEDKAMLIIQGTGEMNNYNKTGAPWCHYPITSVIIETGVSSIGKYAFANCFEILSIDIPNSVTKIGTNAFSNCISLTSVNIPDGVTSLSGAFPGCTSLTSVIIPNSVTNLNSAFYGCTSLTSVNIPNSVTNLNSAFYGCTSLTSVNIPDGVTSLSGAFSGCTSLTSVIIPNSVTDLSKTFSGCTSLTSVNIPDGVTSLYYTFSDCTSLTSVNIPDGVTSLNYTFYGCTSLTSVIIPEGVTSLSGAFYGCTSLNSIVIPSTVTSLDMSILTYCSSLSSLVVRTGNSKYDSRNNCNAIIETASNTLMIGCQNTIIPYGINTINSDAFFCCSNLTSIKIPNTVTKIGTAAFQACSSLTTIIVDEGNPTYDSRDNCNAIIETAKNALLFGCQTSVIPSSVTTIGKYAFAFNYVSESIIIPANINTIDQASFWGCKLKNIVAKNTKSVIDQQAFTDATYNHAMLYVPMGQKWNAVYDGGWYQFINIREMAAETNELAYDKAFTLMNAKSFGYIVYDPINNDVRTIDSFSNVDENVANNSWQVIDTKGGKYLYNIGAKQYASIDAEGKIVLSNQPKLISMANGQDGIVMGGSDTQWNFVLNEKMGIDESVTGIIEPVVTLAPITVRDCYTLDGKRISEPQRGVNIVRMSDGTTKKVVVK